MTKLSIAFVAALSLASSGCKKGGADCSKAIANSMAVSKADMQKMPGVDDKMMAKMADVGVQHCKDDKWPDDAITCMTDAKTQAEAQDCYGKLTVDQQQRMQKAAMELMMPPGGAATGSATDTGSGSAGTAEPPK